MTCNSTVASGKSLGMYIPTFLVSTIWFQHGPALLTLKYCISGLAEIAGGGDGKCSNSSPGTARLTSSTTNLLEHILISVAPSVSTRASPAGEPTPNTQRERPRQR